MASLIQESDGRRRIQFYNGNGDRRSIGLGSISERNAKRICDKVEQLVEHSITGIVLDPEVSRWVAGLDDRLHRKLVKVGLTEPREPVADAAETASTLKLVEFFDEYLAGCRDLKKSSLTVYGNVRRNIIEFFGDDRLLADITEFDADNWRRFLKSKSYAEATINRRCGVIKTVVRAAVRHRIILANPFDHLPTTVRGNPQKRRMISVEDIERIQESCPSAC